MYVTLFHPDSWEVQLNMESIPRVGDYIDGYFYTNEVDKMRAGQYGEDKSLDEDELRHRDLAMKGYDFPVKKVVWRKEPDGYFVFITLGDPTVD